ncbi:hypothetical protein KY386_02305 [Candidatus Parcubacteria bacterium]|nr:hypothetical protein [Candidatus Parcubacteria bacterium]
MFDRFTSQARRVVILAQEEGWLLNHSYVGTEHLLLGLIHEGDSAAAKALEELGVSLESVRDQVEQITGRGESVPSGHIPFTAQAKNVLELALREALEFDHQFIGPAHILFGIVRRGDGTAINILSNLGVDLDRVRNGVLNRLAMERITQAVDDAIALPPEAGSG